MQHSYWCMQAKGQTFGPAVGTHVLYIEVLGFGVLDSVPIPAFANVHPGMALAQIAGFYPTHRRQLELVYKE